MTEQRDQERRYDDHLPVDVDSQLKPVSRNRFGPTSQEELSGAIISAIKSAGGTGHRTANLPPLYEVIDIDALKEMFSWPQPDEDVVHHSMTVTFRYERFLVVVRDDGLIQVYESNETDRQTNQQPRPS
ncbi:hypothetical protein EGH21_15165 [Halomicroarcula sp. F13]|uniref:Halobacterial output domain-containing protein n=1 Tax=Haloarcula rubra TaxID=2487747 RepID=A0AAW4PUQ5_9EURY|nr:HalOD1 output domain-containing protein [Halomicroarcula rubra]MBX0324369.1 hypothetical protein [Halomicroarcula rubra]